jgi:oligosaccharide repeat unit polymerase
MSPERIVAALVATMLLGAAVLAVRRTRPLLGTPIDVVCLFLGVWAGTLALFALPVLAYSPTRFEAWLAIYGSIAATVAGCLLARARGRSSAPPASIDEQQRELLATIDPRRLRLVWLACAVLGLLGFAAFVYAVDGVIGWRSVFADPTAVRALKRESVEFQNAYGFFKLLTYFNQIAFVLWTVAVRMRVFHGWWRLPALLGFASLIPFVFTADRNLMAAALALAFAVHVLWPWSGSWRRVAIVACVAAAVAGVALTAIGNRYGGSLDDQPGVAAQVRIDALKPVAIPYLYLTANLPTFGQLTQDGLAPLTLGEMTALPAVKAAAHAGVIEAPPVETGVFYPIPIETFSNYSWLGVFWLDFRFPGVLMLPLLAGFVATVARWRLAARPSFLMLWTAAILLYIIVYSPLSNLLYTSLTWQYLLLGPVLAVVLDPGLARRALAGVAARKRLSAAVAATSIAAAAGVLAFAASRSPAPRFATTELRDAVDKAHYVYGRLGHYPIPLGLSTRLAVSRPGVEFRPQQSYADPLPPPGVIAVFTQPHDVFLRVRAADGRVYEVHRTERDGGITFGPGTRDR